MSGLRELRSRLAGVQVLDGVVGAMRSIAGIRLRQAQRTMPGLAAYADGLERTLAEVLGFWPEEARALARRARRGPCLLVVFGSEHGFVGGYNDRLLAEASGRLAAGDRLFAVGRRAARIARRRALPLAGTAAMPVRPERAERAALELAEAVWPAYRDGSCARIALLHDGGSGSGVALTTVAPPLVVARPPGRQAPLTHLAPAALVAGIVGGLVVARLIQAFVEALRAENALRLRAMDRAKRNVEERLGELRREERRLVQELTTGEILELVEA